MKTRQISEMTKRKSGAPGQSRTADLLVRSQTLYPAELRAHTVKGQLFQCTFSRVVMQPREQERVERPPTSGRGSYWSILVVIRSSTARSSSTPSPGFAEAYTWPSLATRNLSFTHARSLDPCG